MSAVSRPSGYGPTVDPGDLGWDALGLGVHFTLGNGQQGGLLGNYPLAQREQIMHEGDANAGWTSANYAPGASSPAQVKAAQDYMAALMSDPNSGIVPLDQFYAAQDPFAAPTLHNPHPAVSGTAPAMAASPTPTPLDSTRARKAPRPATASATQEVNPAAGPTAAGSVAPGAAPTQAQPAAAATTAAGVPTATANTPTPMAATGPLTMSGTGDITGSSANYYDPAYGGIPNVPDPISSQYQALAGNTGNLGSITNLAGQLNQFGAQQAAGQYSANLPDYANMTKQASADILANLRGEVPADVINNLQQAAAERGIATGANSGADYLKALGLTSLGQQTLGQQQLTSAIQRTPTSPLFNTASMLVSPTDEQAARMAANLYSAAPQPAAAAQAAMDAAKAGLSAGAGGGVGGGGGINIAGMVPPASTFPTTAPGATTPYPTTVYGGLGGGTSIPSNPYANWQNWYSGLPMSSGSGSPISPVGAGSDINDYNYDQETGLWNYADSGTDPTSGLPYSYLGPSGTGLDYTGSNQEDLSWLDPNYDPFSQYLGDEQEYADTGYSEDLGL